MIFCESNMVEDVILSTWESPKLVRPKLPEETVLQMLEENDEISMQLAAAYSPDEGTWCLAQEDYESLLNDHPSSRGPHKEKRCTQVISKNHMCSVESDKKDSCNMAEPRSDIHDWGQEDESFFVQKSVPPPPRVGGEGNPLPIAKSGLSLLFEKDVKSMDSIVTNLLLLKIFLPDKTSIEVQVPDTSLVSDVIKTVIQHESIPPGVLKSRDSDFYELRMHDEDGEPEDFHIDRNQPIQHFGEDEEFVFCICWTPHRASMPSLSSIYSGAQDDGKRLSRSLSRSIADFSQGSVVINLPNNLIRTITIKEDEEWTAAMLLLKLAEKVQKVRLLSEEYELKMTDDDIKKYEKLWGPLMNNGTLRGDENITQLGITELNLQRKIYMDTPSPKPSRKVMSNPLPRPPKYNEATMDAWEEFEVLKINRRGKEQRRKMGIGLDECTQTLVVTNAKMDESNKIGNVKTRSRMIQNLISVKLVGEKKLQISWDDDGTQYTVHYVTSDNPVTNVSASDIADRIVSKLKCLKKMEMENDAKKKRKKSAVSPK